jgi:hypothetical protein
MFEIGQAELLEEEHRGGRSNDGSCERHALATSVAYGVVLLLWRR